MSSVRLESIRKQFGDVVAVSEVTATIGDGEFVSLLGPSGCGKTTVLRMVAGFEKSNAGSIWIGDQQVNGDGVHVPPNERRLGMVFQTYAVWPHMNVFENIAYPLNVRGLHRAEVKRRVDAVIGLVRLDGLDQRMPNQLSGGQQQRVALARAIVAEPKVLLLDEPLSNLDAKLREELRLEIKLLTRRLGITVLNVTHDQIEAMSMSDRILVMEKGKVVQAGTPRAVYEHPSTRYVASFVGVASFLPAKVSGPGRVRLENGYEVEAEVPQELGIGTSVDAVVRPEGVTLSDSGIPAGVEGALYIGGETELLLTIAGRSVRTRIPGAVDLVSGAGTSVHLRVAATFRRDLS